MVARRALVLGLLALATGCALPAFTLATRERYQLSPADLSRMQFYTSSELVLRREAPAEQRTSGGHGLVLREGTLVEEVVIPSRTPGVILRADGDFLLIGFSPAHPEQSLWFGLKRPSAATPGPLDDLRYELVHLDNPPDDPAPLVPRYNRAYQITYAGRPYRLADPSMWHVHLLYDEGPQLRERVRQQPSGWRLTDHPAPAASP